MKNKNNVREAFQKIPSVDEILSKVKDKESIPDHLLKTKVRSVLSQKCWILTFINSRYNLHCPKI